MLISSCCPYSDLKMHPEIQKLIKDQIVIKIKYINTPTNRRRHCTPNTTLHILIATHRKDTVWMKKWMWFYLIQIFCLFLKVVRPLHSLIFPIIVGSIIEEARSVSLSLLYCTTAPSGGCSGYNGMLYCPNLSILWTAIVGAEQAHEGEAGIREIIYYKNKGPPVL